MNILSKGGKIPTNTNDWSVAYGIELTVKAFFVLFKNILVAGVLKKQHKIFSLPKAICEFIAGEWIKPVSFLETG